VGLSYNYTYINRQYVTPTGDASGKGYSTAFAPTLGIAYFTNRNVALNAGLNYNIETQESPALNFSGQPSRVPTVVTFKSENKLLSLNIGFQLFFGK
jgi:outer membrane protein